MEASGKTGYCGLNDTAGWVRAAMAVPGVGSGAEVATLTGAAWSLAFCRLTCDCAERRASREVVAAGLGSIGLRVRRDAVVRRSGSIGLRSVRRSRALADCVAWHLRPSEENPCDGSPSLVTCGFGLTAFDRWIEEMQTVRRMTDERRAFTSDRARAWAGGFAALAAFTGQMAGTRTTAASVRLRRASCALARVADRGLRDLAGGAQADHREDLVRRLCSARHDAVGAVWDLLDAVLTLAGMPANLHGALLEEPEEELSGAALPGLIYLARAGSPAFRLLAARRLAGSADRQASATLEQLTRDPSAGVARTAVGALEHARTRA